MFCSKCGVQLPDNSNSCNSCGFESGQTEMNKDLNQNGQNPCQPNYNYGQSQQTYQPPSACQQTPQQFNPPTYYPIYPMRPKIPGKGFGITSMILGIFGIIYSLMFSLIALLAVMYGFAYTSGDIDIYKNIKMIMGSFFKSDSMENIIALVFICLLFAVLAFIFAVVSKNKGCRSKITKSGLILSIISLVLVFVFIGFTGYAYSSSPTKEINSSKSNQFWVGKWSLDEGDLILTLNNDNTFEMNINQDSKLTGTYKYSKQSRLGNRYLDDGIEITAHVDSNGNDITFILTKSWSGLDMFGNDNFDEFGNFKDSSGKLYVCEEPNEYYYLSENSWVGMTGEPTEKVIKLQ